MVCEVGGMEKVYALREVCLPSGLDVRTPTTSEYAAYLFDTTKRAHGVFTWKQLLHLKTGTAMREAMRAVVDERLDANEISLITLENGAQMYVDVALMQGVASSDTVKILSPFDNVLIHRERLSALFGVDFRIECYVPAAKRVFGYFCLPIVFGDSVIGRMDCKAHRSSKTLQVLSLHWEQAQCATPEMMALLEQALHRYAAFNQCSQLDAAVLQRM